MSSPMRPALASLWNTCVSATIVDFRLFSRTCVNEIYKTFISSFIEPHPRASPQMRNNSTVIEHKTCLIFRRHEAILSSCFALHVRWPDPRQQLGESVERGDENDLLTFIDRAYATLGNDFTLETDLGWIFFPYGSAVHSRGSKVSLDS